MPPNGILLRSQSEPFIFLNGPLTQVAFPIDASAVHGKLLLAKRALPSIIKIEIIPFIKLHILKHPTKYTNKGNKTKKEPDGFQGLYASVKAIENKTEKKPCDGD